MRISGKDSTLKFGTTNKFAVRWRSLTLIFPVFLMACGEIYLPTGPEPTGRPLITIIEPPNGATRVGVAGKLGSTRVRTSQPFKTIQGYMDDPSGVQISGTVLPAAAPGMYYWNDFGISFTLTTSGIYRHEYIAANEFGLDLAQGMFVVLLNHDFKPEVDPNKTCFEDECDGNSSPPPPPTEITYNSTWLTPDPYIEESIADNLTEKDLHDIAKGASPDFLEYTADQYGKEVEDWLIDNGYLAPQSVQRLNFGERMDRYIELLGQFSEAELRSALPLFGLDNKAEVVRFLHNLKRLHRSKASDRRTKSADDPPLEFEDETHMIEGSVDIRVFPNPIHDRATIEVVSNSSQRAEVILYDALGRAVRSWASRQREGVELFEWDLRSESGHEVPAGRYFVQVRTGTHSITRSITVVK